MAEREALTADYVRSILDYNPETGELRWKWRDDVNLGANRRFAGKIAGANMGNGYLQVRINFVRYLAHRIIWLYATGDWPVDIIDHINGNKSDNRIINLRSATYSENSVNSRIRRDNTSGFKGVYFDKINRKYCADIAMDGRRKRLGRFNTAMEAAAAYQRAAKEMHGEFARIKS